MARPALLAFNKSRIGIKRGAFIIYKEVLLQLLLLVSYDLSDYCATPTAWCHCIFVVLDPTYETWLTTSAEGRCIEAFIPMGQKSFVKDFRGIEINLNMSVDRKFSVSAFHT